MTGETLPGETAGEQTKQWVYTNWCSGTAAQAPCEEIDQIDRLDSSTTTTTRAFYDGEGRLVETRTPGPVGQDVVTYAYYDTSGRQIFKSHPYFVTAYTGAPGAAAYSIPDSTQPGTSTGYSNLRTTSVTDPQTYTSISGSYALYATTSYTYDAAGNLLSTKSPAGSLTTAAYDGLGHV